MAGGSYGRSASLSRSLTNALLIRSLAPRAMRAPGLILVLRTLGPRDWGNDSHTLRPESCRRATRLFKETEVSVSWSQRPNSRRSSVGYFTDRTSKRNGD